MSVCVCIYVCVFVEEEKHACSERFTFSVKIIFEFEIFSLYNLVESSKEKILYYIILYTKKVDAKVIEFNLSL